MTVTIDSNGWIKEAQGIYYPNLTFGLFGGGQPKWIVLHGTACNQCTAQDIAQSWASQSFNGTGDASTHLIIDKNGSYVQGLSLLYTAWGNSGASDSARANFLPATNLNYFTLSIEHCKYDAQANSDILTPEQTFTSFTVIDAICRKYNIQRNVVTIDDCSAGGIIRHRDCDLKYRAFCPGPYPFNDLHNYLRRIPMGPGFNTMVVSIWKTYRRDTGLFNEWRNQLLAGNYKGAPSSNEYNTVDPDSNVATVAQDYGSNTCLWNAGNPRWL
jgi:N-acetylmuramoyl-L-alanine amidase CwlA